MQLKFLRRRQMGAAEEKFITSAFLSLEIALLSERQRHAYPSEHLRRKNSVSS